MSFHVNWESIRAQYPVANKYTYLNTASCGLISKQTAQVGQEYMQKFLEESGLSRSYFVEEIEITRKLVAQSLHTTADTIALIPNFTLGANFMAQMLNPLKSVLLIEEDYPSLNLPWKLNNYETHYLKPETNGAIHLDKIDQTLREKQIKILAISHVQYLSGFKTDTAQLSQICRKNGTVLILDTTQSYGAFPVDVEKDKVDVVISSGYKWTSAGFGNGILYINKELLAAHKPPIVGHHSFGLFSFPGPNDKFEYNMKFFEPGHPDFLSFMVLGQALRELHTIGYENIKSRITELVNYLLAGLHELGISIISDYEPQHLSGIITIEGDMELEKALMKENIITAYRQKGLRLGVHFFNNFQDVDLLCKTLSKIERK